MKPMKLNDLNLVIETSMSEYTKLKVATQVFPLFKAFKSKRMKQLLDKVEEASLWISIISEEALSQSEELLRYMNTRSK